MNKEYWYIESEQQIGPFHLNEFLAKNLGDETIVWFDGLTDWTEYKNIKSQLSKPNNTTSSKKRNKKPIIITALITVFCALVVSGYFIYEKYSFKEEDAKKVIIQFFEMSKTENIDDKIYPAYDKISRAIIMKNNYKINSINEDPVTGNYNVYAEYIHNESFKYPISFVVEKKNGRVQIKSSRGLCFYLYNGIYDYGEALGELNGKENDQEMSKIILRKNLANNYLGAESIEFFLMRLVMEANVKIDYSYFGSASGSVFLHNKSDYDLENSDINFKVNFLDSEGNVLASKNVDFLLGVKAGQSAQGHLYASGINDNWTKYDATFEIIRTDRLKEEARKRIIEKARNGEYEKK